MAKGMRIVTETKEDDVTFLENAEITFVSLVRHGASQHPFRIVKSEGGDKMSRIVQSVLIPKSVKLEDLTQIEGLGWLSDINSETKKEYDEYEKLIQLEDEDFDGGLQMVKLHSSGAYALVGTLKEEKDNAISLGAEAGKEIDMPIPPMEQAVAERQGPSYVITFRDMFEKELASFLDVVRGAMTQTKADPAKRKKQVMTALDSFKAFLAMGLDELSGGANKKEDTQGLGDLADKIVKAINSKTEGKAMFKTKEEFIAAVTEVVEASLKKHNLIKEEPDTTDEGKDKGKGAETDTQTDAETSVENKETGAPETTDGDQVAKEETSVVKDLVAKVATLTTTVEELKGQPAADHEELDEGTVTEDGDEKPSVFKGLLTKQVK